MVIRWMPGLFARQYSNGDVKLTTRLRLVPSLSEWSYTLPPLYAVKDYQPDDVNSEKRKCQKPKRENALTAINSVPFFLTYTLSLSSCRIFLALNREEVFATR